MASVPCSPAAERRVSRAQATWTGPSGIPHGVWVCVLMAEGCWEGAVCWLAGWLLGLAGPCGHAGGQCVGGGLLRRQGLSGGWSGQWGGPERVGLGSSGEDQDAMMGGVGAGVCACRRGWHDCGGACGWRWMGTGQSRGDCESGWWHAGGRQAGRRAGWAVVARERERRRMAPLCALPCCDCGGGSWLWDGDRGWVGVSGGRDFGGERRRV